MQIVAAILVALLQTAPGQSTPAQATPLPSAQPATAPAAAQPGTSVQAPGQPNFGELISSLNNMKSEIAKVQAMNGSSTNNLRPVNVAQLNGANPSTLSNAMTRNQAQLTVLRNALSRVTLTTPTNEHITVAQFLADNRLSVNNVVGVDVANGTLILFYQKP
jgi:hypothetical protein